MRVPVTGQLNAAIANEVGHLVAEFTGRGATRSRAFVHDDVVVCLLEGVSTAGERNLVAAGEGELVRRQRDAVQRLMEAQLIESVERLTGRPVLKFLSGTATDADASVEVFLLGQEAAPADG